MPRKLTNIENSPIAGHYTELFVRWMRASSAERPAVESELHKAALVLLSHVPETYQKSNRFDRQQMPTRVQRILTDLREAA